MARTNVQTAADVWNQRPTISPLITLSHASRARGIEIGVPLYLREREARSRQRGDEEAAAGNDDGGGGDGFGDASVRHFGAAAPLARRSSVDANDHGRLPNGSWLARCRESTRVWEERRDS